MKLRQAILLVDHGSRRAEANALLPALASLVQEQVGNEVIVRFAHMELAEPDLEQAFADCVGAGAQQVIVHPYMLAAGRHASEDIPRLAAQAAAQHPAVTLRVSEPLGLHPLLARIVLERCGFVDAIDTFDRRAGAADAAAAGAVALLERRPT